MNRTGGTGPGGWNRTGGTRPGILDMAMDMANGHGHGLSTAMDMAIDGPWPWTGALGSRGPEPWDPGARVPGILGPGALGSRGPEPWDPGAQSPAAGRIQIIWLRTRGMRISKS